MANRYVKNQSSHPCGQQVTPQRHNRIPLRPQIQQLPSGPRRTHPLPQTPHLKTNQPHQPNNTNTANTTRYAVAELHPNNTETPYPSLSFNNPPGGAINYTTTPPTSANYADYLIGVQSVVLDPQDRLWILDTGRVLDAEGTLLLASEGGAKLVCVDIATDSVVQTIVFPATVAFPDSYVNDVRFDLRPSLSGTTGKGVAYITDSSAEGRNGLIVVDLGSGASWRHLDGVAEVRAERGFVPFVWGQPLYYIPGPGKPLTSVPLGSDGIALGADGEELFFGPVGGRALYSVPTSKLRDQGPSSELLAQSSVRNHGQRGLSDGFETDSNGFIYQGNMEQNQLNFYNPANGTISTVVRDPRISWIDTRKLSPPLGGVRQKDFR
jgi:sugar lactone lactonase YvrE